jgi:peroxiredoxin
MTLDVGDRAPDFTLPSTQGEITLSKKVLWKRSDLPIFHRSAAELREVIAGLQD